MVFSVITLFPSQKYRGQTVEILRSVQDLTRAARGCLCCWISEGSDVSSLRYVEQWDSEEALENHIRSDLYRRLLAAMELSSQPPEVKFYCSSEQKGFEMIESMRSKGTPDV